MKPIKYATPLFMALALGTSAANAAITYAAGDVSGATPRSNFTGDIGTRFGVSAADIPAGQTAVATRLGFYAGLTGAFTGAGVVDNSHVVSLYGPRTFADRATEYASSLVGQVTIAANTPVDANGWAWADLPTAVTLTPAQYYSVLASVVSGDTLDPFYDPFVASGGTASLIAPENVLRQGGVGGNNMIGRFNTTAGAEAFGGSGYLSANIDISIIPEPSTSALFGLCGIAFLIRRRR